MEVYFERDEGRASQFKVFIRADLKSKKEVQFVAPLANIYIGDSKDGSEVGVEAKSLRAWSNFLFILDGYVAAQDATVHAPGGLRIGQLIKHPKDRVQADKKSYPLLCRNSGLWTTQNQTFINGPLNCDGTLRVGGDLILRSDKNQWSFSPEIRVQGDMIFQGSGDFNILRHLGETHYTGAITSSSMYSVPGGIRVEKSLLAEKPVTIRLYSTSLSVDKSSGDISVKLVDSTGNQEIQFPGESLQKIFRASASPRETGVLKLEGKDNQGVISSPKLFLVEEKGQFYLAAKNVHYFEEKSPIQDLMKKEFQLNTTYVTPNLQKAMQREPEFKFHFSLRERFFFNHLVSNQFYEQIQDHVVILQEGHGLVKLPRGSVVFSLSPQFLLEKVQDSCQENLMRGYLYEDRPISLELIAELHRNATEYLKSIGIHFNAQTEHLGADQQLMVALQNSKTKNRMPEKPMIFYRQIVNDQGIQELKPYFYIPPVLLSQAREQQTGNVFATVLGRFSETTTAEEMVNHLPKQSGVREALVEFFEENPETKLAVTQAALRARFKETEQGYSERDSVSLSFAINSPHFAIVAEDDIEIATNLSGKSGAYVSKNGNITLESKKTRKLKGGNNFEESISDQRTLTFEGHLELRAGKNILLTAVDLKSNSLALEAKENVIDAAMMLDSHEESYSETSQESRSQRKAHVSHFTINEDMRISGNNIALQGTQADTGTLQLEAKEKIAVLGVNEESSFSKITEKSTGALFWKGTETETHSESHSQFIPAKLESRSTIGMVGKEISLQAPKIKAEETSLKGETVRFLQGKNTSSTSYIKKSENAFWITLHAIQEQNETHTQVEIQGKVKIEAKTLELEQVKDQVLTYLDHLEYDPAQMAVVYTLLEELHHREEKSISAPGPALIAAVAIAMSVATAGAGGAAVGAIGMKAASAVGAITSAAVSSLAAQLATQMAIGVLAQQSPGDIFKNLANIDTLKNAANSAITAGALYELGSAQNAAGTSELLGRIETSATQAGVGMGASLAFGEKDFGEALKSAGVQFVSQAASGYVASQIGEQFAAQKDTVAWSAHKVAHGVSAAAFGGAGAALLGQDVKAAATGSAMGAMVAETVAELLYDPLQEEVLGEIKKQQTEKGRPLDERERYAIFKSKMDDVAQIAKLTGAISGVLTGNAQGVNAASSYSDNVVENNCLLAAAPFLWMAIEAAVPALMETAAATAFVGSAGGIGYAYHKATENVGSESDSVGQRPPNMAPEEAGREGAFKAAKKANGIPTTQQPDEVLPNIDRRGKAQPGRKYIFNKGKDNEVIIRDDAGGHNFGPGNPQNRGPHFNDPKGNHYDY